MPQSLQLFFVLGSAVVLLVVFSLLKKNLLSVKYSLLWLGFAAVMLLFAACPYVVYVLRDILDIVMPVNLVFLLLFCFVLLVLLSISIAGELMFVKPGGDVDMRLDLAGENAVSVRFHQNEILIVTSDAKLSWYDWNGNRLGKSELTVYTSFYASCSPSPGKDLDIKWDFTKDGELVLSIFGLGNIIDCETWESRAYILNYSCFDHSRNRIVCYADYNLGYFPRYTTEEVIALAVDQLNGYQLPEETRRYYGID